MSWFTFATLMDPRRYSRRAADALAFSSLWVAAAAAALAAAASRAMEIAIRPELVVLAAAGTLAVYTVDRLRDLPRDRATSPERAAFVARHQRGLGAAALAAALVAGVCALLAGPRAFALTAAIGAVGLLHRRLKRFAYAKALYITTAWVAVVVGVPAAAAAGDARSPGATALVLGASVLANAIASNVRDDEAGAARWGHRNALRVALASAALGVAAALLAPASAHSLVAVPLATALAVLRFRPGERYGLLAVDGALLVGGLAALLLPAP